MYNCIAKLRKNSVLKNSKMWFALINFKIDISIKKVSRRTTDASYWCLESEAAYRLFYTRVTINLEEMGANPHRKQDSTRLVRVIARITAVIYYHQPHK